MIPIWSTPLLVLFDRDGTLVHDVPDNGDPDRVAVVRDAAAAIQRLRDAGIKVGLVTNQSGVARGLITPVEVDAVNARLIAVVGPFDTVQGCARADDEGCDCRKPMPGMVHAAAEALGVPIDRVVVVGDIGSDVEAGLAAGCRAVLVPTAATRPEEIEAAPEVVPSLSDAVDLLLTRQN